MAFVGNDQKLLNQQGQPGQTDPSQSGGGTAVTGGSQTGNLSSSGSGDVSGASPGGSSPSSSSGQQSGSGGVGGWTNIQNYMSANQGDTGSANRLNSAVGSQFGQERSNLDQQSSQTKQAAQGQADQEKNADSSASQWLGDAAKNYDYSGKQNDAYSQGVSQFQNALNGQYSGPTSFSYGLSADTQKVGQNLGNDQGFNQWMGDLEAKQAGAPLSDGSRALQSQLDVSNQGLQDARQKALQDYSGLGAYRDQTVADTNKAATQAQQDFANSQNHLKDYLTNQQSADLTGEKNAENDARSGYQNDLNTDSSGRRQLGYGDAATPLTYSQLQSAQDANAYYGNMDRGQLADPSGWDWYHANQPVLQNFYGSEDQKYANTGDQQKREWNAIQDILGTNAAKQSQGFKVRG